MKEVQRQGFYLSIHASTKSVGTMLFNGSGEVLSKSFADIEQYFPENDCVEVEADDVWESVLQTSQESISKAGLYADQITMVSISVERGAALLWDKTSSHALTRIIAPQCKRSAKITQEWRRKRWDRMILTRTGLPLNDIYGGAKLVWLLSRNPQWQMRAKKGEIAFGGLDSWILWKMTGGTVHATDYTNASSTMLLGLRALTWDKGLLRKFKIPMEILPQVKPSGSLYGKTRQESFLMAEIPVGAVAADQPAALFALAGQQRGLAKTTYDRDCHVMVNIGSRPKMSRHGLATTPACGVGKNFAYVLEGAIPEGGWPVHWLKDSLQLIQSIQETSAMAESVSGGSNLFLVEAGNHAKDGFHHGGLLGLHRNVSREELIRSALESVAFKAHGMLHRLSKEAGTSIRTIFADGPMAQNDFLLQFQADLSDLNISRTKLGEMACWGGFCLAALSSKENKNPNARQQSKPIDQNFQSRVSGVQRKKILTLWAQAQEQITGK